ncbi:hypothetical protein HKD37_18G051173 [Glycine soja]
MCCMDEDQWMYEGIMPEEVDMDDDNEEECGVNESHVFDSREDVLRWARSVAYENGFVAVIVRSDTNTSSRGMTSFVLIGCERRGEYRCRKKEFVRRDTGTRKCGCPFKLHGKPVIGGQGWMVKLICVIHNHELAKSLVGHPYVGRLSKAKKTLIVDMTKSMVKPKNILLTLKEHNANSCTTIKQIYNARSAYCSSIRGSDTKMQHLMKLLERDQYIHWHRLKDEDVVRDIFWRHPDAVKLANACNLAVPTKQTGTDSHCFNFIGVTPIEMTFSAGFAYLEGERLNNVVWALERFRGIFLRRDVLLGVIVTDRDLALMNAVKTVFPECTNLLCTFHINKNVKDKCKSLIGQRNAWEYVMNAWGTLFDEYLKRFEMVCSPWPMFVDYVKDTWIIPHKEKFVTVGTNKVMHLGNTTTNSVWDAMNNMMTLQHTKIRASFETSTHIAAKFERVHYAGNNPSSYGCVMRTTHGLPCACELSKYVVGCIPLDSIHMFWRRLSFLDQGISKLEVSIKEEIETISKRFDELDVCGKFTLKTKLRGIAYPDQNSMCSPPAKVNTKGAPKKLMKRNPRSTKRDPSYWEYVDAFHSQQNSNSSVRRNSSSSDQPNPRRMMSMLDQFQPFIHDFIDNIVDVKADGNYGYRASLVRTHLLIELAKFAEDYIMLFGGTNRFEDLRMSLHADGLTTVTMDKWMDITDMDILLSFTADSIVMLTDEQYLDEIYYRQPFTDTGNHLRVQCMQLKNDDDVNTMLMCNHQFSSVGLIELLCTIGRTPDGILNILQATMTPTHDALLYYNGRWNMPRQNEFVGYSFTGKNPKKFGIPSRCTMDELKDLIKQVAPHGIPPYGIHEIQTVSHYEYSHEIIKFEIIELKSNDGVLKVLVHSNYWKKFEPTEILVVFSKHVIEMEDNMSMSLLQN